MSAAANETGKEVPKTFSGKSFSEVDHIINSDGKYLFCKYWKPKEEIRALVFHVHGYAEHCQRSTELAEKMLDLGLFSFTHDHFAHGESEGLRGHVMDYNVFIRDIWQHIDMIKAEYPDLPIFLYGHSLGGGLSILMANERPEFFKGILLSAPYIVPSPGTATPVLVFMAKVLRRILPKLRVGKINPLFLSRDKKQIDDYVNDPLNDNDGMRAGFAIQCLDMSDKLKEIMPQIETPFFLAHSEADQVCDVGGSKLVMEVSKSKDKTFKLYKDPLHMLEHETPDFVESYMGEVMKWIQERL